MLSKSQTSPHVFLKFEHQDAHVGENKSSQGKTHFNWTRSNWINMTRLESVSLALMAEDPAGPRSPMYSRAADPPDYNQLSPSFS